MKQFLAAACLFFFGLASQAGYLYYEEPDPSPFLADIGSPPPCDYTISQNSDWAQINNAAYRVFCVAPGDYSAVGKITITADGTALAPRWIRYYDATGTVGDAVHPYHMTLAQRARVDKFYFNSANYWIVDRMYIDSVGTESAILLNLSDNNVFSRLYMYDIYAGLMFYNGSDYNTVQHTVASTMTAGSDGVAFIWNSMNYDGAHPLLSATFNRVVSNECININDCVHFQGNPPTDPEYATVGEEDYAGAVVYDNDMYLTTAYYTDCARNFTPSGACAAAENAMDVKSGTADDNNRVLIAHNRMWGYRESDPTYLLKGSWGDHLVIHFNVANLNVQGNIFWDGPRLLSSGGGVLTESDISGNLLHGVSPIATRAGTAYGILHLATTNTSVTADGNVISESSNAIIDAVRINTTGPLAFTDNVFINADGSSGTFTGGTVSGNAYYDSDVPSWDTSPAVNTVLAGSDWDNQFCTTIKRLTAPETKCFDNALYVSGEPVIVPPPTQFNPAD